MSQNSLLFINDNIFSYDTQRGVARYFEKIVESLVRDLGSRVVIYSRHLKSYENATCIHPLQFRGRRRLQLHDLLASIAAGSARAKVVYCPYFGNLRTSAREVYTVYDMIFELFPEYFPGQNHRRFVEEKRRCIERADILLAISASTAKDIVACYPHVDASKIAVTQLGVDPFFFEGDPCQYQNSAKPYLLYVGNRRAYKNFLRLLIAFGQSGLAQEFDLRVISPSAGSFSPEELASVEQYRLQNSVQLMTEVSEDLLRNSYASAAAFVYPSEYEGFGLPVLEAMASGTLVATANAASLPEVGGDVAFYFDPRSIEAIVDCLRRVMSLSAEEREERIALGIAHARTFTWERCQQQTVDLFRKLI